MAVTSEIISNICQKTGLSNDKVRLGVKSAFEIIADSLKAGEKVRVVGFGTFKLLRMAEREVQANFDGHNKTIKLPATVMPDFLLDEDLAKSVSPMPKKDKPPVEVDNDFRLMALHTRKSDITYVELVNKEIPKNILALVPEQIARRYQAVPFSLEDKTLCVAMIDPENEEAFNVIRKITGKVIKIYLTSSDDLNHILDQYSSLQSELKELVDSADVDDVDTIEEKEEQASEEDLAETAPAAKVVGSLLKRAVREKASDIHIEPQEDEVKVRFRVDGVLVNVLTLPKDIQAAVISRFKILSNLKIDETRIPQDGRIQILLDGSRVDFRVSTFPTVTGEKIVARVLDHAKGIITLENLGLLGQQFNELEDNIKKAHGMILVTGPTGSGKSTTLYAVIDKIKSETINVVTMEDPVEYRMPGVNQSQVNFRIGYSFASGLRAILRQDPNVVMVGEIRDKETADIAINAALTGHVVLSSLHTNDASGALPRLLDMGIEPFLITSSVNAIVAQRLCRKICDKCKQKVDITEADKDLIKTELESLPEAVKKEAKADHLEFYKGSGCEACQKTGYKGRIGIFEVLVVNDIVRQLTLKRATNTELAKAAHDQGMISMRQDGILKALKGVTTLEEVWRTTKD